MRRLLIGALLVAGLCWLATSGHAQFNGCKAGFCQTQAVSGGFTPSCSQSSAFLARATGITLTADKTNYDNLICGMVTDGTFAKMDALYIFAAPDSTTAKLNLVSTSFSPGVTTLAFSANHGFTGDGATVFDTGFTANTGGSNFVLNGGSVGVYNLTSNTTENSIGIGSFNTSGTQTQIALQPTFSQTGCSINASSGSAALTTANSQGFWQCSRTNSTTQGTSKNGSALSNVTTSANALDNVTITVFCRHAGAGATYDGCVTDQFSSAYIAGSLSNTDVGNVSSRINTFMTAYGINVF